MSAPEDGTDELRFDDRVAIVTGAGRGLGRAHALLLAARGARVVVNDIGGADAVVEEIVGLGGRAVASADDISTEGGSASLVATAVSAFDGLDIVVNNAGIVCTDPFSDTSRLDFDRAMAVHVAGSWGVTQAAWKIFELQRYGRVVVTTSAAGLYGIASPPMAAYCAAKGALYGLTRGLAAEGEALGIRVNALAPRAFTPLQAEHMTDEAQAERLLREQPAELVAPVVALLAHESCPVNGEVLFAGGGRVSRVFMGEAVGIEGEMALTPERVADRLESIMDLGGFSVPTPYVAPAGMK